MSRELRSTALILLSCLISVCGGVGVAPPNSTVRTVCVGYYRPLAVCPQFDSNRIWSGYDIDLFERAVELMMLEPESTWRNHTYEFKCILPFSDGWKDLLKPANESRDCWMLIGGYDAAANRLAQGVRFSVPTFKSGRAILIAMQTRRNLFGFLDPFAADLWILIFCTSIVVGLLVALLEMPWRKIKKEPREAVNIYSEFQWSSTALLLAVTDMRPETVGGRLVVLGYGFVVLITMNQYISVLSSTLTVNTIATNINSLSDLVNRPTGVADYDLENFEQLGLGKVVPLPWNDDADEASMLNMLRDKQISALVIDAPFAAYQGALNCDLLTVGAYVLPTNLAFAFPNITDEREIRAFDLALTKLQESNMMTLLQNKYITPSASQCPDKDITPAPTQMNAWDLGGLWILLAICIAAGILVNFGSTIGAKCCMVWRAAFQQQKRLDPSFGSLRSIGPLLVSVASMGHTAARGGVDILGTPSSDGAESASRDGQSLQAVMEELKMLREAQDRHMQLMMQLMKDKDGEGKQLITAEHD